MLVIAEHNNQLLHPATLAAVSAASKIAENIKILIIGHNCQEVAQEAAKINGISEILLVDAPHYANFLAEEMANCVINLAQGEDYIIAAATTTAKDYMPRIAASFGSFMISEIVDVVGKDTFKRPIYAGNAIATVKSSDKTKIITIRASAFDKAAIAANNASIQRLEAPAPLGLSSFISKEEKKSDRPDLGTARIVVSGGRGIGSKENFAVVEALADKLGAAIGASRAAVDAGYIGNDHQVGQTGKNVAPDLYIALGISGAIQHLAGMGGSKVIVAINKDENAPIFDVADYGIVGDLFEIAPEMVKKI